MRLAGCAAPQRLRESFGRGCSPTPSPFPHSVNGGFARGPDRDRGRIVSSCYRPPNMHTARMSRERDGEPPTLSKLKTSFRAVLNAERGLVSVEKEKKETADNNHTQKPSQEGRHTSALSYLSTCCLPHFPRVTACILVAASRSLRALVMAKNRRRPALPR